MEEKLYKLTVGFAVGVIMLGVAVFVLDILVRIFY
jgi:hypothetical protein